MHAYTCASYMLVNTKAGIFKRKTWKCLLSLSQRTLPSGLNPQFLLKPQIYFDLLPILV